MTTSSKGKRLLSTWERNAPNVSYPPFTKHFSPLNSICILTPCTIVLLCRWSYIKIKNVYMFIDKFVYLYILSVKLSLSH